MRITNESVVRVQGFFGWPVLGKLLHVSHECSRVLHAGKMTATGVLYFAISITHDCETDDITDLCTQSNYRLS
jgi:hypothetical protein